MGYPAGQKGYKIFFPETGKMDCSRDVKFLESSLGSPAQKSNVDVFDITTPNVVDTTPCTTSQHTTSLHSIHSSNEQFETNLNTFDTDSESGNESDVDQLDMNVDFGDDARDRDAPRIQRNRREPDRYGEWATIAAAASSDPKTFKQAMKSPQAESWKEAMENEHQSLLNHNTWDLVDLPAGANLVGCKWVFKTKHKANGEIDRYKARLVAQGYSQEAGVDYDEV